MIWHSPFLAAKWRGVQPNCLSVEFISMCFTNSDTISGDPLEVEWISPFSFMRNNQCLIAKKIMLKFWIFWKFQKGYKVQETYICLKWFAISPSLIEVNHCGCPQKLFNSIDIPKGYTVSEKLVFTLSSHCIVVHTLNYLFSAIFVFVFQCNWKWELFRFEPFNYLISH